MLFLALNNVNVQFRTEKLTQRFYIIVDILPTTSWSELINKREFANAVFNRNSEIFVIHVVALEAEVLIYLSQAAEIATPMQDKAPTKILVKYIEYVDVFSFDLVLELSKNTGINEHVIELVEGKQPLYGFIYAYSRVEQVSMKTYIKTQLKIGFI